MATAAKAVVAETPKASPEEQPKTTKGTSVKTSVPTTAQLKAIATETKKTREWKLRKALKVPLCSRCGASPKTDIISMKPYCPHTQADCPLLEELEPTPDEEDLI